MKVIIPLEVEIDIDYTFEPADKSHGYKGGVNDVWLVDEAEAMETLKKAVLVGAEIAADIHGSEEGHF